MCPLPTMIPRQATLNDVPTLMAIEKRCWKPHLQATEDTIRERIMRYPQGQYVLELDSIVHGVLYTQRIRDVEEMIDCGFSKQALMFDEGGEYLQLLAINVPSPLDGSRGLGNAAANLRSHALLEAAKDNSIIAVVAMTRCSTFEAFNSKDASTETLEQYVHRHTDPTIFFHVSGGAHIRRVVEGYRPEDYDNLGSATLICYDLKDQRRSNSTEDEKNEQEVCHPGNSQHVQLIMDAVMKELETLIDEDSPDKLKNRPFLSFLDSMQIQIFHKRLEIITEKSLSPSFLFKYPTLRSIEEYFLHALISDENFKQSKVEENLGDTGKADDSIAIVGVSFKLPAGIDNFQKLFDVKGSKISTSSRVPLHRFDVDAMDLSSLIADPTRREAVQWGNFIEGIDMFDNEFFGVSVEEAKYMDPNQRLVLETVVSACVDSGMDVKEFRGDRIFENEVTGMYVGISNSDFEFIDGCGFKDGCSVYAATGSALSVVAGRVSYLLGFRGPSMVTDTACSSSLVAIHQACDDLKHGKCSRSVVAGINLILTPWISVQYARAGMTSADGTCHSFDESANGYSRGEGCVAMVLKRLKDAQLQGDEIYAVIRGSAVMQDGKSASLTAPNALAQVDVVRRALVDANVHYRDVCYVEAHGTGTILGDPIEIEALKSAYCQNDRKIDEPLHIGSLKANIGHLEAASGIAGILSVILSLQTGIAFPNGQSTNLNKRICDIIVDSSMQFPIINESLHRRHNGRLLAGVSSFGYSGTIAHAILEEVPEDCMNRSASFGFFKHSQEKIENVTSPLSARSITISSCDSVLDLTHETIVSPTSDVIFQFRGQGVLNVGSGSELFIHDNAFRMTMLKFEAAIRSLIGISITSILYPDELHVESASKLISETRYSQPILIALECSLANMWISKGVIPRAVLGHSIGEYAACCVAGVLSIEDTAKLACRRGELTQKSNQCRGCMAALRASVEDIAGAITRSKQNGNVTIAAVNGENNIVISGSAGDVDLVLTELSCHKHFILPISYAFHSPRMSCILPEFARVLAEVSFMQPTNFEVISTVTGSAANDELIKLEHWLKHVTNSVLYQQAIEVAWDKGGRTFIEIGPEALVLTNLGRAAVTNYNRKSGSPLEHDVFNGLWLAGIDICSDDCKTIIAKHSKSTTLINQSSRCDIFKRRAFPIGTALRHDILQRHQFVDLQEIHQFSGRLHGRILREISSFHSCTNKVFFPVLSILEVIIAAAASVNSGKDMVQQSINDSYSIMVHDFVSISAMEVIDPYKDINDKVIYTSIHCSFQKDGCVSVFSDTNMEAPHATADVEINHLHNIQGIDFDWSFLERLFYDACSRCNEVVDLKLLYSTISASEISYNASSLVAIDEAWISTDRSCCVSSLNFEMYSDSIERYEIPPVVLKAIQDTIFCLHPHNYELLGVERIIHRSTAKRHLLSTKSCKCILVLISTDTKISSFDCMITCPNGTSILALNRINIVCSEALDNKNREVKQFSTLASEWKPIQYIENIEYSTVGSVLLVDASESGMKISPHFNNGDFNMQNVLISSEGDIYPDLSTLYKSDNHQTVIVFVDGSSIITCNDDTGRITKGLLCLLAMICDSDVPSLDRLLFACKVESGPINSSSLYGLIQTARLEFSRIAMSVIFYRDDVNIEDVICQELSTKKHSSMMQDSEIMYEENQCFVRRYFESSYDVVNTACTSHSKPGIDNTITNSVAGGTYVVTGGLGALGLVTAKVLARLGAKRLVLLSRSGAVSNRGQGLEKMLTDLMDNPQVSIHIIKCDVSIETSVEAMLCSVREFCNNDGGIDGIIHSAGLLRDAIIHNGKAFSGFDDVWAAKALSAFWLHKHTKTDELKFFIVYSSIVTAIGNVGQSVYGASNAFLDGLIEKRVQSGLAGCSIRWPAISDIGMAAATSAKTTNELLEWSMPPNVVEAVLEKIFTAPPLPLSMFSGNTATTVTTIFPDSYADLLSVDRYPQLRSILTQLETKRNNYSVDFHTSEMILNSRKRLEESTKIRDRIQNHTWTEKEIEELVTKVVNPLIFDDMNSERSIDRNIALVSCGLDSLGTTELSGLLSKAFDIKISPMLVFEHPTIADIIEHLKQRLLSCENHEICTLSSPFQLRESPLIGRIVERRYFHAIKEEAMSVQSMGMLSFCRWNCAATELLKATVKKLLELNPILTGCIEKGTHAVTGQTGLCVAPHRYSLDSIFSVIHDGVDAVGTNASPPLAPIPSDGNDRSHDRDLKEMMQAVSSFCGPLVPELGNGWDQKRNKSRLFAVTVIALPSQGLDHDNVKTHGQDYAVVHIAMSHAIGDGYTYYKLVDQLNQLMKEGNVTTPLRWNEPIILLDSRVCVHGKSKALISWSKDTVDASTCYKFTMVDSLAVEESKSSINNSETGHLSMSDMIFSSITSKLKLRSVFFAVNTRNIIDGLTSDLAGDFSIAVSLDVDPNKNVNLSEEIFKLIGALDGKVSRKVLSQGDTIISDLTSITTLLDVPVKEFKLFCQLPYHRTTIGFKQALIFKANAENIAIVEINSAKAEKM